MKPLAFVFSVSLANAVATASPVYFPTTESWYDVVLVENTWTAAKAAAETMSYMGFPGRLATITSQAENDFILQSVLPVEDYGFWIGGVQPSDDLGAAGQWEWISGETWSFTNWDIGEPNNAAKDEDFLQIYSNWVGDPVPARRLPGTWNDLPEISTAFSSGYVVEFATVPEPTSAMLAGIGAVAFSIVRRQRRSSRAAIQRRKSITRPTPVPCSSF